MNPYEADPEKIPTTDLYADVPFYGRYCPKSDDFRVDLSILCTEEIRIYPADEGGRDVFALGCVIVKSSHLHAREGAQYMEIDFSYADANELRAIALAKTVLKDVKVPEIYFTGKINGRQVLVQERLPGVGLAVVWPYLSNSRRKSYKKQAREILRQLHTIKPTEKLQACAHVVPDPNIVSNGWINLLEGDILFSGTNYDPDMRFMHNDFTESNCIVDNARSWDLLTGKWLDFLAGRLPEKSTGASEHHSESIS